jgi:hypothetical protein
MYSAHGSSDIADLVLLIDHRLISDVLFVRR